MNKVIFTSLGPDRAYTDTNGQEYHDSDVAMLEDIDYDKAVTQAKFAQDFTPELEEKTLRLVQTADKKRKSILDRMQKLK